MKFLGDMGISPRTIALLREQGYDAIHLIEENLEKMTDPNILEKARQEERILYQNTKWRSHFVLLKPLQGFVFNSQKCSHTFVNWYYSP
jgi:hypothetical protein